MELTYKFGKYEIDFTVAVGLDDIYEYLTPKSLNEEEKSNFQFGVYKVFAQEWLSYDKMEEDKFFYDFMKKKYENDAFEYFKKYYDEEEND